MKKRGISPLIATVLIIGAVIVIAAIFMIWGTDFLKESIAQTEIKISKSQRCFTDLDLEILDACYDDQKDPPELIFRVENKKGIDLGNELFLVRIYSNGEVSIPIATSTPGALIDPEKAELKSLDIKNFKVNYPTSVDKFELIPQVDINGEKVFCENIFEFDNIKEC